MADQPTYLCGRCETAIRPDGAWWNHRSAAGPWCRPELIEPVFAGTEAADPDEFEVFVAGDGKPSIGFRDAVPPDPAQAIVLAPNDKKRVRLVGSLPEWAVGGEYALDELCDALDALLEGADDE